MNERLRSLIERQAGESQVPVEEAMAAGIAEIPPGKIGTPVEVTALVTFPASEQTSCITCWTVQVDGGLTRGFFKTQAAKDLPA